MIQAGVYLAVVLTMLVWTPLGKLCGACLIYAGQHPFFTVALVVTAVVMEWGPSHRRKLAYKRA